MAIKAKEEVRIDIKNFENLLAEYRASTINQHLELKQEMDMGLMRVNQSIEDSQHGYTQIATMIRNQSHHFTELVKTQKVHSLQIAEVMEQVQGTPEMIVNVKSIELYLHKYQPMQIFNMIHNALTNSMVNAPTRQRLDIILNSAKTIKDLLDRARAVGTPQGQPFVKDFLEIIKTDYEKYDLQIKLD